MNLSQGGVPMEHKYQLLKTHFVYAVFFIFILFSSQATAQERGIIEVNSYKIKGGSKAEWLALYKKNHLPILLDHKKNGLIEDIQIFETSGHQLNPAWDYRVLIFLKNWSVRDGMEKRGDEVTKQLYPNQEQFKKEENRRWEITEVHWDEVMRPVKQD